MNTQLFHTFVSQKMTQRIYTRSLDGTGSLIRMDSIIPRAYLMKSKSRFSFLLRISSRISLDVSQAITAEGLEFIILLYSLTIVSNSSLIDSEVTIPVEEPLLNFTISV